MSPDQMWPLHHHGTIYGLPPPPPPRNRKATHRGKPAGGPAASAAGGATLRTWPGHQGLSDFAKSCDNSKMTEITRWAASGTASTT